MCGGQAPDILRRDHREQLVGRLQEAAQHDLVAQNGADRQSFGEKATRKCAADLAGDSGDCVHDGSPEG
jgi:hypothetical protein